MADRSLELAAYFAETRTPLRDQQAIQGELRGRWPDLTLEEIKRALEISIELVKARLNEAELLLTRHIESSARSDLEL